MDTKTQQAKTTEEIDLFQIFNMIGNGFKNFFNKMLLILKSFLIVLIRKSLWIIFFTILGLLLSYVLLKNTNQYYYSEMVVRSNAMDNTNIIRSLNSLNALFINKNYEEVSNSLGISVVQAKKIKSINAYFGIDLNKDSLIDFVDYKNTYNPKDTNQNRILDIFYLKVGVYDQSVLLELEEGIKKYVNTNTFILHNNAIRKEQIKQLIKEYSNEIEKLYSLQKIQYFEIPRLQKSGNSQILVLNEKEFKLYHNEIINLINKKLELEKELAIHPEPITIIQEFSQHSEAVNNLLFYIKYLVPIFSLLGLCLSLIWQHKYFILQKIKGGN